MKQMAHCTEQRRKEALSISLVVAVEEKHKAPHSACSAWYERDKRESYSPGSPVDRRGRSGSWSWSRGWVGSGPSWLLAPRGSEPAACCSSQPRPDRGPGPGASLAPPPPAGRAWAQRGSDMQTWSKLNTHKIINSSLNEAICLGGGRRFALGLRIRDV